MQKLLTGAEVLDRLRISRPTLGRWCLLAKQGKLDMPLPLQATARGKRLWCPVALEQWTERRQAVSVAPNRNCGRGGR
jgi:hypothetical protein